MYSTIKQGWNHWFRLTLPVNHPLVTVVQREHYRKVRLLSTVQLYTILLAIPTLIHWCVSRVPSDIIIVFSLYSVIAISLFLNRRGYFNWATSTFICGYIIIITLGLIPNNLDTTKNFFWEWSELALPTVFAGLFLPFWTTFLFTCIDGGIIAIVVIRQYSNGALPHLLNSANIGDFISTICVVMAALAVISSLYGSGLNNAIALADRSDELMAMNDQLRTVIDTIHDGLLVIDLDQHIMRMNQAGIMILGNRDFTGQTIVDIFQAVHPKTLEGIEFKPENAIITGDMTNIEFIIHPVNQPFAIITANWAMLSDAQGTCTGYLFVFKDSTQEYHNVQNLQVLQQIAKASTNATSQQEVADAILNTLLQSYHVAYGLILTTTEEDQFAHILSMCSGSRNIRRSIRQQLEQLFSEESICADSQVEPLQAMARNTLVTSDQTPLWLTEMLRQHHIHDVIFDTSVNIPLSFEGQVFGALSLSWNTAKTTAITIPSLEYLTLIGQETAIALHHANLFESTARLAQCDPLTNLFNHRALHHSLKRELLRAGNQGNPVSVIMLDIDHFRKFNELYGHDTGDRALRQVAQAIQNQLGKDDVAARYGGEEFTILLPGASTAEAARIAEKIRSAAESCIVVADDGLSRLTLTVSQGFATFPQYASAPASLIKAADLALYSAKRGGRNKAVGYSPDLLNQQSWGIRGANSHTLELSLPTGANLETIQAFITAIDLRDGYTAAHSDGVSNYALAIGSALRLPQEQLEALRLGGLIHDVGKIGVPDQILRKPGKLTDEEWTTMRSHTTMGESILQPVESLQHLLPLVRWHHERLDGSGYPDGLTADKIPQLIRILSIADVFEAFTADRPYHPGRTTEQGLSFLNQEVQAGRIDADIVAVFETIIRNNSHIIKPFPALERKAA